MILEDCAEEVAQVNVDCVGAGGIQRGTIARADDCYAAEGGIDIGLSYRARLLMLTWRVYGMVRGLTLVLSMSSRVSLIMQN